VIGQFASPQASLRDVADQPHEVQALKRMATIASSLRGGIVSAMDHENSA